MNNKRRQKIRNAISNICDVVEDILEEEEESYENMPEGIQTSIRGAESEEAQDNLHNAIGALEEAISCLEDII